MRPLRLYHKLLIAMGAILLLLSVSFYTLVQTRIEKRTIQEVNAQLVRTDLVFRNLRASQAKTLAIVASSISELSLIKALAEAMGSPDADRAELAKNCLEQCTSLAQTVGSDIMFITDQSKKVLARVSRGKKGAFEFERAYGRSELVDPGSISQTAGSVLLKLSRRSQRGTPPGTFTVTLPAGHLIGTDEGGVPLPPETLAGRDGAADSEMPFLDRLLVPRGGRPAERFPVGFWMFRDELYQLACTKIGFAEGEIHAGAIVVGFRIGKAWALDIKRTAQGDVAFFLEGKLLASSFDAKKEAELSRHLPTEQALHMPAEGEALAGSLHSIAPSTLLLQGEHHLSLVDLLPETRCHYLVALSLDEALAPLHALERELKMVGCVIFAIALIISGIVASGITRPLAGLSVAMEGVMKGDFNARLSVLTPLEVAQLAKVFNNMVQGLSEREQYRKMVSRSASALVQKLATGESADEEVSHKVEATVLFTDIRGFTTLSEGMSPEGVVSMLNDYFEAMGRVIAANDGDIDKFIGDAIMAFFKSTPERDSAESAVLCAIQMQREMSVLNERRRAEEKPEILIGIGLNTGVVVEGHVGTKNRFEHTMLGDTVNVASRLEGECKRGQHLKIVISQSTYDRVQKLVEVVPMGSTKLKGKTEELPIYEIKALSDIVSAVADLDDASPPVRIRAVERLARLGSGEQLELLFKRLGDADRDVRIAASIAIGQLPDLRTASEQLIAALDREKDEPVRLTIIEVLGNVGGLTALEHLKACMWDESPAVRKAVLLALERLGGRAVAELLAMGAADKDGDVRGTAALALFRVGKAEGMSILEEMADAPEMEYRRGAARVLGGLGVLLVERWHVSERRRAGSQESYFHARLADRVAERLIGLLKDAAGEVRVDAILSLTRMRHRGAVRHLADMVGDPVAAVAAEAREAIRNFGD